MDISLIKHILVKDNLSRDDLVQLLSLYNKDEKKLVYDRSKEIKKQYVGNKVYLRGLIEYSNICAKDCFYCGIRAHNKKVNRYTVSDEDVIKSAVYAYENKYASIVIQSGEVKKNDFRKRIATLLQEIHQRTNSSLKITLSCGEQTYETYRNWFDAGAHRYLLRIESSNENIYRSIHPESKIHSFKNRLEALINLKKIGYQIGTGIMIGLPEQTLEDLANDLLFLKKFDVHMVGMGPYVEHIDTPMYSELNKLLSQEDRYNLSMLMFALLRILMKDINIASTTALDALNSDGRIEALDIASNVIMPNLTPVHYTENYHLYNNKPDSFHSDELVNHIKHAEKLSGNLIALGEHGDSLSYIRKFGKRI